MNHLLCIYGYAYILTILFDQNPKSMMSTPAAPRTMAPNQFFKCLSDETRMLSMMLIAQQGELCVCELMVALDDSQPKISRHLAQLRNCGLLSDRRDKQWVYYSLPADLPDWARSLLDTLCQQQAVLLEQPCKRLENMSDRPVRCAAC